MFFSVHFWCIFSPLRGICNHLGSGTWFSLSWYCKKRRTTRPSLDGCTIMAIPHLNWSLLSLKKKKKLQKNYSWRWLILRQSFNSFINMTWLIQCHPTWSDLYIQHYWCWQGVVLSRRNCWHHLEENVLLRDLHSRWRSMFVGSMLVYITFM